MKKIRIKHIAIKVLLIAMLICAMRIIVNNGPREQLPFYIFTGVDIILQVVLFGVISQLCKTIINGKGTVVSVVSVIFSAAFSGVLSCAINLLVRRCSVYGLPQAIGGQTMSVLCRAGLFVIVYLVNYFELFDRAYYFIKNLIYSKYKNRIAVKTYDGKIKINTTQKIEDGEYALVVSCDNVYGLYSTEIIDEIHTLSQKQNLTKAEKEILFIFQKTYQVTVKDSEILLSNKILNETEDYEFFEVIWESDGIILKGIKKRLKYYFTDSDREIKEKSLLHGILFWGCISVITFFFFLPFVNAEYFLLGFLAVTVSYTVRLYFFKKSPEKRKK